MDMQQITLFENHESSVVLVQTRSEDSVFSVLEVRFNSPMTGSESHTTLQLTGDFNYDRVEAILKALS